MEDDIPGPEKSNPTTETAPERTPAPEPKKQTAKLIKRIILGLLLLLAAYLIYSLVSIFVSPDRKIQQVYLIPKDAVFIIQTNEPVADWNKFSRSQPWLTLKKAPAFAGITGNAEYMDSVIRANKTLLSLVGKREMMISVHKTRSNDWDFLMVVDLQKVSKVNILKDQIEQIYKMAGQQVTTRKYNEATITELRDSETRDILYTAFVDNHFIASYSARLVEASVDERNQPFIGRQYAFIEVEKMVSGKGLCRLYVNYAYLPQFMTIYLGARNEYLDQLSGSMEFAGMYATVDDSKMEVKGYSLLREEPDPYVAALLSSGKHKMKAHEIMSARTAFYANFGFDDVNVFVKQLEQALATDNRQALDAYHSAKQKIEKYFNLSLDEHFLGWMSGEFALSQSEPGLLGREPELILAIRAKNIRDARKNMELIGKRIKGRTPVSIKAVEYKGYEVNYVDMKGFFKLFFGKLFEKFETPFYTYIDDYVVFSTTSASLLSFIEDYEQGNLMKNEEGFKRAFGRASHTSTIFAYADMPKFYGQLPGLLNAGTWKEVSTHRDVLYSFPQWVFQMTDEHRKASLLLALDYVPYTPPTPAEIDRFIEEDTVMNEEAETEKELMSELKRFYVEKFQGNVLREYDPDGNLMSEAEIRDGKRHGRYREYYASGALRLRGKYAGNRPKGTWKYYTEEGKFDRKEKF